MPRVGFIMEDEMQEALNEEAEKTHILPSELMRMAIREFLSERGYKIVKKVKLGGKRVGSGRPKSVRSNEETQEEE
jgi:predicted transcriptional regulator